MVIRARGYGGSWNPRENFKDWQTLTVGSIACFRPCRLCWQINKCLELMKKTLAERALVCDPFRLSLPLSFPRCFWCFLSLSHCLISSHSLFSSFLSGSFLLLFLFFHLLLSLLPSPSLHPHLPSPLLAPFPPLGLGPMDTRFRSYLGPAQSKAQLLFVL